MDMSHIGFLRENIHKGFNYCSLILCTSVPHLERFAKENKIQPPENIEYIDYSPPIAYLSNNYDEIVKQRYFIIHYFENKGLKWCASQMGLSEKETLKIAGYCRVPLGNEKTDEIETPSLHDQVQENKNKMPLEEYILMNHTRKNYCEMSKDTGETYTKIQGKASSVGIKKRECNIDGDFKKILHYARSCRIIMTQIEDSPVKRDLHKFLSKIEKAVYLMGES